MGFLRVLSESEGLVASVSCVGRNGRLQTKELQEGLWNARFARNNFQKISSFLEASCGI